MIMRGWVLVLVVVVGVLLPGAVYAQTATPYPAPTPYNWEAFPLAEPSVFGQGGTQVGYLCVSTVLGNTGAFPAASCKAVSFANSGIEDNGGQSWYDYQSIREIWTFVQRDTTTHRARFIFLPPPGVKSVQVVCSAYASTGNTNYTALTAISAHGFVVGGSGNPSWTGEIYITDAETSNSNQTESLFINSGNYADSNTWFSQALVNSGDEIVWPVSNAFAPSGGIAIAMTAQKTLGTINHSGQVDCMFSVRRNPAAPGGSGSGATATITPTIAMTITPPSCLPGAIGYPCSPVGTGTPWIDSPYPTAAPYPTMVPWPTALPWPTPAPGGTLLIGEPTTVGCFVLVPGFEFKSPSWIPGIPDVSFGSKEFSICLSEVAVNMELFGINVWGWMIALLAVGAGAMVFNIVKRS